MRVLQAVAVRNTMNASDAVSMSMISIFVGLAAHGIYRSRLIIQRAIACVRTVDDEQSRRR